MENNKESTFTAKIWNAGSGTPVITIPKNTREILNIDVYDYVEIRIKKIDSPITRHLKKQLQIINKYNDLTPSEIEDLQKELEEEDEPRNIIETIDLEEQKKKFFIGRR